jgi:hypothetical protein
MIYYTHLKKKVGDKYLAILCRHFGMLLMIANYLMLATLATSLPSIEAKSKRGWTRGFANELWLQKSPDSNLHHLDYYRSDHRPILTCIEEADVKDNPSPSILRLDAWWLKEKNFMEVVQGARRMSAQMFKIYLWREGSNVSIASCIAGINLF